MRPITCFHAVFAQEKRKRSSRMSKINTYDVHILILACILTEKINSGAGNEKDETPILTM
jgi:hypothetical protein